MIELDGIEYHVATPEENVTNMTDYINNYCAQRDIRNSKGELIYIEQNTTSPLYMILYGLAYLVSALQRLVYNVGCTFSISSSSERQLLNLATLANVKRKKATRTTISAIIYADRTTDDPHNNCVITRSLSVTIPVSGTNIVFRPAYDITIPIGGAALVLFVADQDGAYAISEGSITAFDTPVTGLRKIQSSASVMGQEQEPIASLRERLQARAEAQTQIDKAMEAIQELDGVSLCNIYFNEAPTSPAYINNIEIPPRQALLIVQGYNDNIAEAFYTCLTCQTVPAPEDRLLGGGPQYYYTKAGQAIPVYIVAPKQIQAHVRIYVKGEAPVSLQEQMKDAVSSLVQVRTIGQELSSADIINVLKDNLPTLNVLGAEVSLDEGENYSLKVTPSPDSIVVFSDTNISVLGEV